MNWPLRPSSIQSWCSLIGSPPLSKDFEISKEIDDVVAPLYYGAAGCEGTFAARRYPIGEYELQPIILRARYRAWYS